MKNEKGYTLISTIVYLLVATVIIALVVTISAGAIKTFRVAKNKDSQIAEINKINMYMLTEMNNPDNKIDTISSDGTYIAFSQGSAYTFKDNILYKDTYKVAEGIGISDGNKFFSVDQQNGKVVLTVNMQIDGKEEQDKYAFRGLATVDNEITPFDSINGVNRPGLETGMIPIYYDGTTWRKADIKNTNNEWYDYSTTAKKYANICTVSDATNAVKGYRTAPVDTGIPVGDMTTMFVWIPRYAYSINAGGYRADNTGTETEAQTNANPNKKIDVTFLVGTTDDDMNGVSYAKDYNADTITVGHATPKIVHPGFTFGNKELAGIWVGKFEVSGTVLVAGKLQYVGNGDGTTDTQLYAPNASTYVQILPNAISWGCITIGESEYQAMKMGTNSTYYGWNNVNTHLMKNSEWGVAAYLAYSQYGQVPEMNATGKDNTSLWISYNIYTGAGPQASGNETQYTTYSYATNGYYTNLGQLASTTGNIYGLYDMSGGSWEYVAGYLDNKSAYLDTGGSSTSDTNVSYFENNEVKPDYSAYWDKYAVGQEERDGATSASIITSGGNKTQDQLWTWTPTATSYAWNDARKRLTDATFNNMKANKGIGVNEVSDSYFSYLIGKGKGNQYAWGWFKTLTEASSSTTASSYGGAWNTDQIEIGHAVYSFIGRGRWCRKSQYCWSARLWWFYIWRKLLVCV